MLCVFLILVEGLTSAFCILAKKPFDSFSGGWDQSPDNHVVIISYLSLSLFFPEIIFPPLKACNHHGSHMITPSDPASPDLTLFSTPLPLSPPSRPPTPKPRLIPLPSCTHLYHPSSNNTLICTSPAC